VCAGFRPISSALQIDVLIHRREQWRPSSTGRLVNRVFTGSRQHVTTREQPVQAADVRVPGRELWILHPAGGPLPPDVAPEKVQVLLLDASWREAADMRRDVGSWGRVINLPMAGESRYWLRAQQDGGRFSTVEALMFLLGALGLERERTELQLQFELHVYAGLRSRGRKTVAEDFLATSPLRTAHAELLAQLQMRRPR
jgi:DTW domain-containing protein YfiP